MGGAVSAAKDNDELIDKLHDSDYIKSDALQRVFRAVDRGVFCTSRSSAQAYRDVAWKYGNLHISAPCIYTEVLDALQLRPGLSFLNIGSGTGYLNSLVGLRLGTFGVNHGIEIHRDCVDYAYQKVEELIRTSSAIDQYDFAAPSMVVGNGLLLPSDCGRQYDRIYVGAELPSIFLHRILRLVKPNGLVIVPVESELSCYRRCGSDENETIHRSGLLSCSFAVMKVPQSLKARISAEDMWYSSSDDEENAEQVDPHMQREIDAPGSFPPIRVPTLLEISRRSIRQRLRKRMFAANPAFAYQGSLLTDCPSSLRELDTKPGAADEDERSPESSTSTPKRLRMTNTDSQPEIAQGHSTGTMLSACTESSSVLAHAVLPAFLSANRPAPPPAAAPRAGIVVAQLLNENASPPPADAVGHAVINAVDSSDDEDVEDGDRIEFVPSEAKPPEPRLHVQQERFRLEMEGLIRKLPLPDVMQAYMNYNREFTSVEIS